jgi:hypothetical protein
MRNLRALQRDPSLVPKGACEVVVDQCLCRLLDRTPSERSEDKLVFLISANLLPSGWALMMRAIK